MGSSRWRAGLISSLWRRRSSKWMPKLLHKGDISLRVRPVTSQSERAGVSRFVPFYFSPRYRDHEDRLRCEAEQAFRE